MAENTQTSSTEIGHDVISIDDDETDDRKLPAAAAVGSSSPIQRRELNQVQDTHHPGVAALSTPQQPSASGIIEVIDLCDDSQQCETSVMKQFSGGRKRKRQGATKKSPVSSSAEAIEIDLDNDSNKARASASSSDEEDSKRSYLQALGPHRFDFVDKFHGRHVYGKLPPSAGTPVGRLYRQLLEYKLNLPVDANSSIFVRAMQQRLDLVRVLITGPEGTPYASGCFLFDVYLNDYPNKAPAVKFLTTGNSRVRFNPNLYADGKVCLSLLGTWSGPGWISNKSTLLQVLVSIQGLILVPEPYYNEPGYEARPSPKQSEDYSKNIRKYTLQYAMNDFLKAALNYNKDSCEKDLGNSSADYYPEFANCIERHFCAKASSIEAQLDDWVAQDNTLQDQADMVRRNLHALLQQSKAKRTLTI